MNTFAVRLGSYLLALSLINTTQLSFCKLSLIKTKKKKKKMPMALSFKVTDHATKNQDGDLTNTTLETLN